MPGLIASPIVIDNGTGSLKAGFAGGGGPSYVFPPIVGRPFQLNYNEQEKNLFIGDEAQRNRDILDLTYPIENGVITNWEDMEKIWHHIFFEKLNANPKYHPLLMTQPPLNPRSKQEKLTELMFESFECSSLYVAVPAVLAPFGSGRSTGIVLDMGESATHCVPIYEGVAINGCISRFEVGGKKLTEYLTNLLNQQGEQAFSTTFEEGIVNDIKEKLLYVSEDFEKDVRSSSSGSTYYSLPDGRTIIVGNERFRCPECLFKPNLMGINREGIHKAVYNSVMKCNEDIRKELFSNIVLCGGTSMIAGIDKRLDKELNALVPRNTDVQILGSNDLDQRRFSAWKGGCVFSTHPSFRRMCISKEDYFEYGPRVASMRCI